MREVIKHKSDFFIMKCPRCDCVFRYTLKDIIIQTFADKVECPECNIRLNHYDREKDLKECKNDV